MLNYKFLKKLKNFLLRFKFFSFSVLITAIIVPFVVFAAPLPNTPAGGYRSPKLSKNLIVFHYDYDGTVYPNGNCVENVSSSNDYFIPTANIYDWRAFFNNRPVILYMCKGDKICDATANENCYNAPEDCGVCASPCNFDHICTQDEDNQSGFCPDCDQSGGSTGPGCNIGVVPNGSVDAYCNVSCRDGYCLEGTQADPVCNFCGTGGGGDGCMGSCGPGCYYYCGCSYPGC